MPGQGVINARPLEAGEKGALWDCGKRGMAFEAEGFAYHEKPDFAGIKYLTGGKPTPRSRLAPLSIRLWLG
jgi:hypothetical protein